MEEINPALNDGLTEELIVPSFVHLRVHSEYSLTSSIIKVKKLVAQCKELSMPAAALTDNCNFYALVKFYKTALGAGVKPIVGSCLLYTSPSPRDRTRSRMPSSA